MTGLRERKKQQTRELIIDCAGQLFATEGFAETTIEQVAAASDVSPGTVYNYFGTKNTLLLAHLGDRVSTIVDRAEALLKDPPPELEAAVVQLLGLYVNGMTAIERELLREVFAAGLSPASELLPELIQFDELLLSQLTALLEAHRQQLNPDASVADAAALLFSILGTQLIMYVSVDTISPAALHRTVVRQVRITCAGIRRREGNKS